MDSKVKIGIDIGATNTKIGVVTSTGVILTRSHFKTKLYTSPEKFTTHLVSCLKKLQKKFPIVSIGIGAPNGNKYTKRIESPFNLGWKRSLPIVQLLECAMNIPVSLTNDANASAIGEMMFGNAQKMKNFMVITLGTGLGCGIVVDGAIVDGNQGHAGEIGHIAVFRGGRLCNCSKRGCLETYVSATGLVDTAKEILENTSEKSKLKKIPLKSLTAKKISFYAQKGDSLAIECFYKTGKILGQCLADSVTYTNPEAIFLLGGLAEAKELILFPTRHFFHKELLQTYKGHVEIYLSKLSGADAAILGAAFL